MKKSTTIDLQNYLVPGSRVFTGRNRGIEVRNASKIDDIEAESDEVIIKVPANIGSINPSFLEEFLLHVVIKLKKDNFFKKFRFENSGRYSIGTDLQEAVERILREETVLTHQ